MPLLLMTLGAGDLFAQRPGTTVQLPTLSSFSVGTTVTVPDRGSAYLGGISRAATGRTQFGTPMLPLRNSAIGRRMSTSGVRVTATIHDFQAMDEFLLSGRPVSPMRPPSGVATLQPTSPDHRLSWDGSSVVEAARRSAAGLAEARVRRASQQRIRAAEAVEFFQRGQKAEAAGKPNVAKIFYHTAALRATGQLKQRVDARLAAVSRPENTTKVAQSRP